MRRICVFSVSFLVYNNSMNCSPKGLTYNIAYFLLLSPVKSNRRFNINDEYPSINIRIVHQIPISMPSNYSIYIRIAIIVVIAAIPI